MRAAPDHWFPDPFLKPVAACPPLLEVIISIQPPVTLEEWSAAGAEYLPGLLSMRFVKVETDEVVATLEARRAPSTRDAPRRSGAPRCGGKATRP